MSHYDLAVIGSGPAGKRAAIQAAKLGKSVAIIEKKEVVGGVTVHTGTIPSKTLREAVLYLSGWRQRGFYGRSYKVKDRITAKDLKQRLDVTLRHEVDTLQNQLSRNGVDIVHALASFVDPHTLQLEMLDGSTSQLSADRFVIAVGTAPNRPDHFPFDGEAVVDSDDLLEIKKLPRTMTVIGAGVIGIEYATIFSALDMEVSVVDARDDILGFVDREIIDEFVHNLRDRNMLLRLGEKVAAVEKRDDGRVVTRLESGRSLCSDLVLVTAGRTGMTQALALANVGLEADQRGRLKVNEHYQTEVPHIYAAGDVIGFPALASTSMEQGRIAACHAFGVPAASTPDLFPYGVYAVPEISMVGLTEKELQVKGIAYEAGVARLRETARGQIRGVREGILKLLFALDDQRLLGVHITGTGATELVHIGQAVMALGGTLSYFIDTAFNYPTLAEAYKIAALDAYNRMPALPD